jgi:beta-lactamase class A
VLRNGGLLDDVRAHRLAVALVDITDLRAPRVASVNGDDMMYAASLPKIAILLAAFHKAEYDGATITPAVQQDIESMIRVSSNEAATRVLHWVGPDYLLELLQSPQVRLYDPAHNGGLWVGKDYGGAPAYERDPLHHLSHGATAMQVARFFFMLETEQLGNGEYSERMKEALGHPGISHKFVKGLASRPDAVIYRKSGTWGQFHADGALVEAGSRRFIIVGLAADPQGGEWLASMAAPLYDLVVPRDFGIPTSFAGLRATNAPAPPPAPTRVARQSTP